MKLQNLVLKALQGLREKGESEREGNYSSAHKLIFVSGV